MGDIRYFYKSKYLASHSIIINPVKGLTFALGESVIYSDRMDIGFLLPINLFKIYDNKFIHVLNSRFLDDPFNPKTNWCKGFLDSGLMRHGLIKSKY